MRKYLLYPLFHIFDHVGFNVDSKDASLACNSCNSERKIPYISIKPSIILPGTLALSCLPVPAPISATSESPSKPITLNSCLFKVPMSEMHNVRECGIAFVVFYYLFWLLISISVLIFKDLAPFVRICEVSMSMSMPMPVMAMRGMSWIVVVVMSGILCMIMIMLFFHLMMN